MLRRIYKKWSSWWNGSVITDICGLKLKEISHQQMRFMGSSTSKIRLRPGLRTGPRWGTYSAPPAPLAGGEGARCSLSKSPSPPSAFSFELQPYGPQQSLQRTWVPCMRNQNCWKGSASLKKVENTVVDKLIIKLQYLKIAFCKSSHMSTTYSSSEGSCAVN